MCTYIIAYNPIFMWHDKYVRAQGFINGNNAVYRTHRRIKFYYILSSDFQACEKYYTVRFNYTHTRSRARAYTQIQIDNSIICGLRRKGERGIKYGRHFRRLLIQATIEVPLLYYRSRVHLSFNKIDIHRTIPFSSSLNIIVIVFLIY